MFSLIFISLGTILVCFLIYKLIFRDVKIVKIIENDGENKIKYYDSKNQLSSQDTQILTEGNQRNTEYIDIDNKNDYNNEKEHEKMLGNVPGEICYTRKGIIAKINGNIDKNSNKSGDKAEKKEINHELTEDKEMVNTSENDNNTEETVDNPENVSTQIEENGGNKANDEIFEVQFPKEKLDQPVEKNKHVEIISAIYSEKNIDNSPNEAKNYNHKIEPSSQKSKYISPRGDWSMMEENRIGEVMEEYKTRVAQNEANKDGLINTTHNKHVQDNGQKITNYQQSHKIIQNQGNDVDHKIECKESVENENFRNGKNNNFVCNTDRKGPIFYDTNAKFGEDCQENSQGKIGQLERKHEDKPQKRCRHDSENYYEELVIHPCDVSEMFKPKTSNDIQILRDCGNKYFDDELKQKFELQTVDLQAWIITHHGREKLDQACIGHFYDQNSYIYFWKYCSVFKGRTHENFMTTGDGKAVYFYWQGSNCPILEKGSAAYEVVDMDKEGFQQIQVVQGSEPPLFLKIFKGEMMVCTGKQEDYESILKPRLFMVKGDIEDESYLLEVPSKISELRSRGSFIILDSVHGKIYVWYGSKSSQVNRQTAFKRANNLKITKLIQVHLNEWEGIEIIELHEEQEDRNIFEILGYDKNAYYSLVESPYTYDHIIRLFKLAIINGNFTSIEILPPHNRPVCAFPFMQTELYSERQPAIILIDNNHELWLWFGWWPEELAEQSIQGSRALKWRKESKAAIQTTYNYWKHKHPHNSDVKAYIVWAGLEPLEFKSLFPTWINRNDVAELNKKKGRSNGEQISIEEEITKFATETISI